MTTRGWYLRSELNLIGRCALGMLGLHCLDAGWGQFLSILAWVSWKRGVYFSKVNARGTSQFCPACDPSVPKDLSVRVHNCPSCGYQTNRDVASGQLVRKRRHAAVGHRVKKAASQAEEINAALKQELLDANSRSQHRTAKTRYGVGSFTTDTTPSSSTA